MRLLDLQIDLDRLVNCEFVRYFLEKDTLKIQVVADNETSDEEGACPGANDVVDECCGLNGRLFEILFTKVHNESIIGEECDNYKTLSAKDENQHFRLELEGHNLFGPDENLTLEFDYDSYSVKDLGPIRSPDV